MITKQINPDVVEIVFPKALSTLFPKLSFTNFFTSDFRSSWIIFLNAISHPYNLINFTPSIIYVQIFTLWSLNILIYLIIEPFTSLTYNWRGTKIIVVKKGITPGQPNLSTRIIITPIKITGLIMEEKKKGLLSSIVLKSFEIMLIILPYYCDFMTYWDNPDNFLKSKVSKIDRSRAIMIATSLKALCLKTWLISQIRPVKKASKYAFTMFSLFKSITVSNKILSRTEKVSLSKA